MLNLTTGLNVGESLYKVDVVVHIEPHTLKIVKDDIKVNVWEYNLSNKYVNEFGEHEVFELLPGREEKIVTGWENNHDGRSIPCEMKEPTFSFEDFYGNRDYFEIRYVMWNTDREIAKTMVYEKIQELVKNSEDTYESLSQIAEEIYSK